MMKLSGIFLVLILTTIACQASQNSTLDPSITTTATSTQSKNTQSKTKPLVVTTVAPITNIVSNIAGDRVEVKGIIPEGSDSHTFEPSPSEAELLSKANLIITNGLGLEVPAKKLANSSKPKDTKIYELGNNTIAEKEWLFDFSFPKEKGDPNPHLWVNPKYAMAYAKLAAKHLTELDPDGKNYYETNLKNYLKSLEELDKATRTVVATIPERIASY